MSMPSHPSMRGYDLVAFGDPVLDVCLRADELPAWDDKRLGRHAMLLAGGSEANAACAASKLGLRTALFGRIGDGPEAGMLRADLQRHGVDAGLLHTEAGSVSALATVYVSAAGERGIVYVPMPPAAPRWEALEAVLPRTRCIYLLPYDMAIFSRLATLAHRAGTEVVVDVERAVAAQPDALAALCAGADVLCFNEAGFREATGTAPSLNSVAALLARSAAHTVVVSLGQRGALAVDRGGDTAVQAAYACEVVDTTGAGDSFNAGFVAARLQGQPLATALAQGCAAAALCIEAIGARAGLGDVRQVRALQLGRPLASHTVFALPGGTP